MPIPKLFPRAIAAALLLPRSACAQAPAADPLEPLFHSTLEFYNTLQRTPKGLYLDVHLLGKDEQDRKDICSAAAVGIGLMSLCMTHELGRDPEAKAKALQTLRTLNGKTPGFTPPREKAGFFMHFFSAMDGSGNSEYSTIDTAIMVVGALFCRNTFDDPEINAEADALWNTIDWPLALATPGGDQLHMVMVDGKPHPRSPTKQFNEYYILAWLIKEAQLAKGDSSEVLPIDALPTWDNDGITVLSDPRKIPKCSFLVQFVYYMCHPCTTDPLYRRLFIAQAKADQRACFARVGVEEFWGCGAGRIPGGGYRASSYDKNPDNIVAPHIIAGFMPAVPEAQDHLLKIYRQPKYRVKTAAGELLPRFSVDKPDWRPNGVESIDYASMLFGLAGIHPKLGMNFFHEKTKLTFNQAK